MLTASTAAHHYAFVPLSAGVAHHEAAAIATTEHQANAVRTQVALKTTSIVAKHPAAATHAVKVVAAPAHLSAKALKAHKVHQDVIEVGPEATAPIPGLLAPAQVRAAYGISNLPNQGAGTTIGIVDVFNDPAIAGDIVKFSAQYGLPQLDGLNGHGTFTSLSQPGTPNSPSDGSNSDTSLETALDVEWAHSIAPLANIVLYQVASFSYLDLLNGVQFLVGRPGVTAVSVSYGGREFAGETAYESYFTTPFGSNPSPVAISFSTGDNGYPSFPATSPSVLAVGGTGLYVASTRGGYGFETAWGNVLANEGAGGGGVSSQYASPTFQSSNGVSFARRAIPDISAIADPLTAVSVINSWDSPSSPWVGVGGTSLATPVVSAIVDLSQEIRIDSGLLPLSSPQINARLYAAYANPAPYATYFHDVTVGKNTDLITDSFGQTVLDYAGFNATTGYDLATGIGSPMGDALVACLAAP